MISAMFTSLLLAVAGMAPTAAVARATSSPVATSFDDTAAAGSALEFSGRGLLTEQGGHHRGHKSRDRRHKGHGKKKSEHHENKDDKQKKDDKHKDDTHKKDDKCKDDKHKASAPVAADALQLGSDGGGEDDGGGDGARTGTSTNTTSTVDTSGSEGPGSVECTSITTAYTYADATDAHVSAVAEALVEGCSEHADPHWMVDFVKKLREDTASVVAKAIVSAYVTCTATGNAYGCGAAKASANAWAHATASAHADAVARALNDCPCMMSAEAENFGEAEDFEIMISADVSADVDVYACAMSTAGMSATVEAYAVSQCIEKKYAKVVAEATAKAMIAGNCDWGLEAQADIEAITEGSMSSYSDCD